MSGRPLWAPSSSMFTTRPLGLRWCGGEQTPHPTLSPRERAESLLWPHLFSHQVTECGASQAAECHSHQPFFEVVVLSTLATIVS